MIVFSLYPRNWGLNITLALSFSQNSKGQNNSRNGHSKKTVQSNHGEMELSIPRDRQGSFEPVLVPKHQRRIAELDEKNSGSICPGNEYS